MTLVAYIGGDYRNAVQDGAVVNPEEYREMTEFSTRTLELFDQLPKETGADTTGIQADLRLLHAHVAQKRDSALVADLARKINETLITAYNINTAPPQLPSFQAGRVVFNDNCAVCHGAEGRGDGPGRATMKPQEPPPANLRNPEVMGALSPFKAFNTISFGVDRTAMPDFSALPADERWRAAFYLFSLRFSPEWAMEGKKVVEARGLPGDLRSVRTLAALSDKQLLEKLEALFPDAEEAGKVLAYLRRGLLEEQTDRPLIITRSSLQEAMRSYEAGDRDDAYQKAVAAYLDGFELAEPALFARDASWTRKLEGRFAQFRTAVKRGDDIGRVKELYRELDAGLLEALDRLNQRNTVNPFYISLNAALIILREGLEAALVLAAILALVKTLGNARAAFYIHLGWLLALLAGLLTWVVAQHLVTLSGSHRESIEGFTTLAAAAVLFYVGFWLHTKSEAGKWQRFIHGKVQGALSRGGILALVGVSFFAVYREAFEVVLFYQALWLESSDSQDLLIVGFVVGFIVLMLLVLVLLRLGLKVPLKHFFGVTGALLFLLAFVFAGQGVRKLQTAGWFSVTPLDFPPPVNLLGLYPTVETLVAQGVIILALAVSLVWAHRGGEGERGA